MKITEVKPLLCQGGIRNWVFVKVYTDEGVTGIGDGTDWPGERIIATAIEEIGPYVVGEDPLNIEKLWYKMYSGMYSGGKIINCAISAIDNALWDIAGKVAGLPVYKLLGGQCFEKIRLYTHCDAWEERDALDVVARKSEEFAKQGFTGMKTHPSTTGSWARGLVRLNRSIDSETIRHTAAKIKAMREAVGEDVDIAIDVNNLLDVPSAIKLARALEPFDLMFYEDPVRQDEGAEDMRRVKEATTTPIATGENLYNIWSFRQFLEKNAIDVATLDIAHCGGMTQAKKIVALANAYHVPVAPHSPNSPLSTIIGAHLCASTLNFKILEILWPDVPWVNDVLSQPLQIKDGYLELPEGPGWGVELVEPEIVKHPYERSQLLKEVAGVIE